MTRLIALAVVVWLGLSPVLIAAEVRSGAAPKVLIITGDHGHDWKSTTPFLKDLLTDAGMSVDVTETPASDLTTENLASYDVLLLNYRNTPKGPEQTRWSEQNQQAFEQAVRGGKGLVVYHHASSAFVEGDEWSKKFEQITAGGWRKQGFHGARHEYDVTVKPVEHPITRGIAGTYPHHNDELYQNSLVPPDAQVLATAWSDKQKDPKNTDQHEPMVWVTTVGQGRVVQNALGHDVPAMESAVFKILMIRCVEWAATGETQSAPPAELKPAEAAAPAPKP